MSEMLTPAEAARIAEGAARAAEAAGEAKDAWFKAALEAMPEFAEFAEAKRASMDGYEVDEALATIRSAAASGRTRRVSLHFHSAEGRPPVLAVAARVYGRAVWVHGALGRMGWDCGPVGLPYAPHDLDGPFGASCSFEVRF